jgi:tRNA-splicing ligase RtcB
VELQVDDDDDVWLTVHSGSRGVGQAIRDHALAQGRSIGGGLIVLDDDSDAGRAYLDDVRWARAFAAAGRSLILARAAAVIGDVTGAEALPETTIDGDHNHVVRAVVDGTARWVHRKGAVSAGRGEAAVIPGSMGTATFHVVGRGCTDALCSSSHGAGRVMSRSEARRRIRVVDLGRQTRGVWFDHRKAARLVDEAPSAYKDIEQVMRAQKDLTRIERRLRPLLSFKGV